MEWMDPLTANLLDLLFELRKHSIPLTIGGGFGLYLKRMRLDQTRERTLFSQLPMPRATNDLDLFLRADVLCDLESMKAVAAALDRLGYEAVPEAMYMQWKKHFDLQGQEREIKVDLLVGPLGQFRDRLHVKGVRAAHRFHQASRPHRGRSRSHRRVAGYADNLRESLHWGVRQGANPRAPAVHVPLDETLRLPRSQGG